MIVLFTDFGWNGPYVGQMKAVLKEHAPDVPVIDLMHDVPAFNPLAASHLLAAFSSLFPQDTVFLSVIDPGVGHPGRRPYMVQADGRWYVGPDNGLFDVIEARALDVQRYEILWRPELLSASFHGRDLFAPVAAMLSLWQMPDNELLAESRLTNGDDLKQVIYIDHYGNVMTGISGDSLFTEQSLRVGDTVIPFAETFSMVKEGELFWYVNSSNLVEIAVNKASASERLKLSIGTDIAIS